MSDKPTVIDPSGVFQNGMYVEAVRELPVRTVISEIGLNVRKGPGVAYDKIAILKAGQVVTIYEVKGEWARIAEPVPAWAFMRQLSL